MWTLLYTYNLIIFSENSIQTPTISRKNLKLKCRLGIPVCFLNSFFFNTGNPLGVHTQGFVGVSYPGEALGQRVSHTFGIRTCDPSDSFLTILPLSHWDGQKFGLGTKLMSCSLRIYLLVVAATLTLNSPNPAQSWDSNEVIEGTKVFLILAEGEGRNTVLK